MLLLILPQAANFEINHLNICFVDHDKSETSARFAKKITSSGYFVLTDYRNTYQEALYEVERDDADVVLEIPNDFEKNILTNNFSKIYIAINTVNGVKGSIGVSYLTQIINDFCSNLSQNTVQLSPKISISSVNRYNPHLRYKDYMVPGLLVMLVTLMAGFLTALNAVSEKEQGTIEQLNVTPLSKKAFVLGKIIPFWCLSYISMTIGLILAYFVYGLSSAGPLWLIYMFAALYIMTFTSLGFVISNYSSSQQQAMFTTFFFLIIFLLLSGLFTPIGSMPQWAKYITYANPVRYFIEFVRMVFMKGSGFFETWRLFLIMGAFAVSTGTWGILSFRKSVK
jgi:ABC-2 type transport system permease protein